MSELARRVRAPENLDNGRWAHATLRKTGAAAFIDCRPIGLDKCTTPCVRIPHGYTFIIGVTGPRAANIETLRFRPGDSHVLGHMASRRRHHSVNILAPLWLMGCHGHMHQTECLDLFVVVEH